MTYCLAIKREEGLVFASDTRTSAGVDYVTSYRKMHVFTPSPDRFFVILSAGSLATTQEIIHWLERDLEANDGRPSLLSVKYLFEAAHYLGQVSRSVQNQYAVTLTNAGVSGESTFIIGGQIGTQVHDLFLIYPQGNFIKASDDTPYLQIGESKYGKPMLDRLVTQPITLEDAARLALVSLDATIRSNLTVGAPVDLALYRSGGFSLAHEFRFEADSPYFTAMKEIWQKGIVDLFYTLPKLDTEVP